MNAHRDAKGQQLDLEDIQSLQDHDEIAQVVVQNVCVGDSAKTRMIEAVLRGTLVSDPSMRLGLEKVKQMLLALR
jgi:hypothetical protein